MRVIAGSAGGIRLDVPKTDLRPTMDRVKAAIFSSLGDRVLGARVLDLFAGTGALGIEALSRGSASVLFVERDRTAVATIERNLRKTGLNGTIRQGDVLELLRTAELTESYDLIFADPPYDSTEGKESYAKLLLASDRLPKYLTNKGLFILEKRPGQDLPSALRWEVIRRRTYGATESLFLEPRHSQAAD